MYREHRKITKILKAPCEVSYQVCLPSQGGQHSVLAKCTRVVSRERNMPLLWGITINQEVKIATHFKYLVSANILMK